MYLTCRMSWYRTIIPSSLNLILVYRKSCSFQDFGFFALTFYLSLNVYLTVMFFFLLRSLGLDPISLWCFVSFGEQILAKIQLVFHSSLAPSLTHTHTNFLLWDSFLFSPQQLGSSWQGISTHFISQFFIYSYN